MDVERFEEKRRAVAGYGPRLRALFLAQDLVPSELKTLLAQQAAAENENGSRELENDVATALQSC